MTKHLVVVAGNIGVGKTSLTERIGSRLSWWTGYESVADNPYLADFYSDMRAWAFHLQVFFLGHRAEQYMDAVRDPRSAILDRSIYEDFYIFARALHHMGRRVDLRAQFDGLVVHTARTSGNLLTDGAVDLAAEVCAKLGSEANDAPRFAAALLGGECVHATPRSPARSSSRPAGRPRRG